MSGLWDGFVAMGVWGRVVGVVLIAGNIAVVAAMVHAAVRK